MHVLAAGSKQKLQAHQRNKQTVVSLAVEASTGKHQINCSSKKGLALYVSGRNQQAVAAGDSPTQVGAMVLFGGRKPVVAAEKS